jgi:hypothetical protein
MVWLYLLGHFFLYVFILWHRAYFQTEKGIFLYHLISAIVCVLASAVIALIHRDQAAFSLACALVAVRGIYSISFLGLWPSPCLTCQTWAREAMRSQSWGRADRTGLRSQAELVDSFSRIGDAKKSGSAFRSEGFPTHSAGVR